MVCSRFCVKGLSVFTLLAVLVSSGWAADPYEYDVTFKHYRTDKLVHMSAWMPDNVPLKGVLYMPASGGGDTRYQVAHPLYQNFAESLGLALVGMKDRDGWPGKFLGNTEAEIRSNVQLALDTAASGLGAPQISNAPLTFYGFSKGGWTDGVLAATMPERTMGFIADKCNTWVNSISDDAVYAPGLIVGGNRDTRAGTGAALKTFKVWRRSGGGQAGLAIDWSRGHSPTDFALQATFIAESMSVRYMEGQLPSTVPGNPMALNQVAFSDGWLVETSSNGSVPMWIREPEVATYGDYTKTTSSASWMPTKTMAMVLRAQSAADESTGRKPVEISTSVWPQASDYAYQTGQTIDLTVTNDWLDLADVTGASIYHGDELIGSFATLDASGVSVDYLLADRGVHTFWAEVTYLHEGTPTVASDYFTVIAVPEPGSLSMLMLGGMALMRRRYR